MAPQLLHTSSPSSMLPASLVFSRLGGSSSSVFHCKPTWSQGIHSDQGDDLRLYCNYVNEYPTQKTTTSYQDGLESHSTPTRLSQHSIPSITPTHDSSFPGTAEFPSNNRQGHIHQRSGQDRPAREIAQKFLPSFFYLTKPEVANRTLQRSPAQLLPPIDLANQCPSLSLQSLKPSTNDPLIERAPSLLESKCPSSQIFKHDLVRDNLIAAEVAEAASPSHSKCPRFIDSSLRQPSLHKSSGSRELRQQAGWPVIGPRHPLQAGESLQSYRSRNLSEEISFHCGQPITPSRKPRLSIDALSSEERVEKAVRDESCKTTERLHRLSK